MHSVILWVLFALSVLSALFVRRGFLFTVLSALFAVFGFLFGLVFGLSLSELLVPVLFLCACALFREGGDRG